MVKMITMEEIINNEVKKNNYSRLLEPNTEKEKYSNKQHEAFEKAIQLHEKMLFTTQEDEYELLRQEINKIAEKYRIIKVLKFLDIM